MTKHHMRKSYAFFSGGFSKKPLNENRLTNIIRLEQDEYNTVPMFEAVVQARLMEEWKTQARCPLEIVACTGSKINFYSENMKLRDMMREYTIAYHSGDRKFQELYQKIIEYISKKHCWFSTNGGPYEIFHTLSGCGIYDNFSNLVIYELMLLFEWGQPMKKSRILSAKHGERENALGVKMKYLYFTDSGK